MTCLVFSLTFGVLSQVMSFACLWLDWANMTGKPLGPVTCLPHEDGGIPLSVLPEDTSKLAYLFSLLSFCVERQVGKL